MIQFNLTKCCHTFVVLHHIRIRHASVWYVEHCYSDQIYTLSKWCKAPIVRDKNVPVQILKNFWKSMANLHRDWVSKGFCYAWSILLNYLSIYTPSGICPMLCICLQMNQIYLMHWPFENCNIPYRKCYVYVTFCYLIYTNYKFHIEIEIFSINFDCIRSCIILFITKTQTNNMNTCNIGNISCWYCNQNLSY